MASDFLDKLNNGGWDLAEPDIPEEGGFQDSQALPYINDPKAWEQFHNESLYDCEVRLRNFIEKMSADKKWKRDRILRKYTFKMLFEILYGRPYDGGKGKDSKYVYIFTKLFAYYSTSITNGMWDRKLGKQRNKTAYTLKVNGHTMPPYSLKLRLEWLLAKGELPDYSNMKLPKDDLKPGHSRNPKTEANKEARRQAARERYNDYQRKRKERIAAEHEALQQAPGSDSGSVSDYDASGEDCGRGCPDEGDS